MIESKIQKKYSLKQLTTWKIGGEAELFLEVNEKEELLEAVDWANENNKDIIILGGGSNVLINDQGVKGLVIKITNMEISSQSERMRCGAGANLTRASRVAISNNLSGLEWAIGIPGATIGGSIRGNAGAFGSSMGDLVETVEVFNTKNNKFELFSRKDCLFSYRTSVFKADQSFIIWQVVLRLRKEKKDVIDKLAEKSLDSRAKSHPKLFSAGCVFKNLDLNYIEECNAALAEHIRKEGINKDGVVGTGWLIDFLGLKGKTIGGAKISLEHANFIVNTGKATSEDVEKLINTVKKQAKERYGIDLVEEVQYLGY